MSDIRALIDELLAQRFALDEAQCAQFARYYEMLVDWNTRMNLTAITAPQEACEKHFLDSLRKRVGFLEAVIAELGLANARAFHDRAELFAKRSENRDAFDWATARAVARLPLLLEYCLPFVRVGGGFIACKGPDGAAELAEAAKALQTLQGVHEQTFVHSLPGGDTRDILLIRKTGPTPKRFPRNPGAAAKSPLL